MKELTMEEKAKRYDEALKVLHKYDGANIMFSQSLKEEMFPELRESGGEDEKMKKIISSILLIDSDDIRELLESNGVLMQDVDAWLEKIGEHLKFCKTIQIGDRVTRNEGGVLVNMSQLDRIAKPRKIQSDLLSCDNVEPKFKVGDWIIHNKNIELANSLMLVTDKVSDRYLCKYRDGQCSYKIKFIDKEYRLWTIQDAKDGDVLAAEVIDEKYSSPFIAIYKERGLDFFNSYCFVTLNGEFVDEGDTGHDIKDIHPATKEQRDTLMKAMADAGYTFDFEKKELKKIEKKPAWSEEDSLMIDETLHFIDEFQKSDRCKNENDMQNSVTCKNWLKALKDRVYPTQEWGEEDEMFVHGLIRGLTAKRDIHGHTTFSSDCIDITKTINWLKSLKNRVQPQQKWSEEDERIYDSIIYDMHKDLALTSKQKNWFKSLKYRVGCETDCTTTKEWSEEDEGMLNSFLHKLEVCDILSNKEIIWIKNKFKSLISQNRWKPSDEQLEALEHSLVDYNIIVFEERYKILTSLYNELKKLKG